MQRAALTARVPHEPCPRLRASPRWSIRAERTVRHLPMHSSSSAPGSRTRRSAHSAMRVVRSRVHRLSNLVSRGRVEGAVMSHRRRSTLEKQIQAEIESAIGSEPDLLLLRNQIGEAVYYKEDGGE